MKRKVGDAYDRVSSHRDQCRRAIKELVSAEEELNDSLAHLGQLMKDTLGATLAPIVCAVPDRESNEFRCLQEELDMIEEFQWRGPSWGTTEITLGETGRVINACMRGASEQVWVPRLLIPTALSVTP